MCNLPILSCISCIQITSSRAHTARQTPSVEPSDDGHYYSDELIIIYSKYMLFHVLSLLIYMEKIVIIYSESDWVVNAKYDSMDIFILNALLEILP